MRIRRLVEMANDIGNFFSSEPVHNEAVTGIANHIKKFWDPRMRNQILQHLKENGEDLEPIVQEALKKLKQ